MKLVVRIGEEAIPVEVERLGSGYRVGGRDGWTTVDLTSPNPNLHSLRLEDGTQFLIIHHRTGARHELAFGDASVHLEVHDPLAMKRRRNQDDLAGDSDVVKAVMPGRVVRILVEPGQEIRKGQGLLVIEAMKMENEISSPRDGKIAAIHVDAGRTVEGGAELVSIE